MRTLGRTLLFVALCLPALAGGQGGRPSLASLLTPLAEGHKGRVAIAVKNLKTGESFDLHADEPMPTASLCKFPVMIEAYRQAEAGIIDMDATVTLKKEDKVPGSGILTDHFSDGTTFPLRDAIRLMIVFSDNTATNLVLDRIGLESTAKTMEALGFPETKIHSKVYRRETSKFPERSKRFGLGSTTAADMVRLFEMLHEGQLVSPKACEAMTAHLLKCDDVEKFPRFLPEGTRIAFKTGSVDEIRTAAGIIDTPQGPVALCVLTEKNEDRRYVADNAGNRLCAEVALAVFRHFGGQAPDPPR